MNYYNKYSEPSPRVKKLLASRVLSEKRKAIDAANGNNADDFAPIIRLFSEPVYGGQDAIIKAHSKFQAARRDRVFVSAILDRSLQRYVTYAETPRWPDRQNSDWFFSSLLCAALNSELDILPDRLESVMKDLIQVAI